MSDKACPQCRQILPITDFTPRPGRPTPFRSWCRSCEAKAQRTRRLERPEQYLLSTARYRARRDGVLCTLTAADIVIPKVCPILDIPLMAQRGSQGPLPSSPSLDRTIPALGYVPGNVAVISHRANRMKSDLTVADLKRLLAYLDH